MHIIKKLIFIIVILAVFVPSICFAGLEDWKVKWFGGPAKGDDIYFTSIAVSDWVTAGVNVIYCTGAKQLPSLGSGLPPIERRLYEFIWTGTSWKDTYNIIPGGDAFDMPRNIGFYNARNEANGIKRLYFATMRADVFEYTYTGNSWRMDSKLPSISQGCDVHNFAVLRGGNDNDIYIYKSTMGISWTDEHIDIYKWDGNSWEIVEVIPANKIYPPTQLRDQFVNHYLIGNGRNDGKNYMYLKMYDSPNNLVELEWSSTTWQETLSDGSTTWRGPGWKESSRIPIIEVDRNGSPRMFISNVGNGHKFYILGWTNAKGEGIYECTWRNDNSWKTKLISNNSDVACVTYGKISHDPSDPVAVYVLIGHGGCFAEFCEERADKIIEYTFKNNNWYKTWEVKLFEEGMKTYTMPGFSPAISELCMINGRNEKITDENGNTVDEYQRLYVVDSWGNMWECSILPRKLRPDYKEVKIPTKKPTITGE